MCNQKRKRNGKQSSSEIYFETRRIKNKQDRSEIERWRWGEVKEHIPIFDGGDIEGLFKMVDKVLKLATDYKWFLHHNLTKKKAFMTIGHALGRKPEKHWREVMQGMGNFAKNNLERAISDLIKKCLNNYDCHKMQVDYLKEMHKPKDWKFGEWLQRIKTINEYLEYMDSDLPKLMECQIIKDVIQWNLPPYLQMKFIEAGGHQK